MLLGGQQDFGGIEGNMFLLRPIVARNVSYWNLAEISNVVYIAAIALRVGQALAVQRSYLWPVWTAVDLQTHIKQNQIDK
jgi:hypothetical protein